MKFYYTLLFIFIVPISFSQDFGTYISNNAIDISDSSQIFVHLNDYDLIMVGEMHGTNEPAELVELFAEILLKYSDDSISIGLEIPTSEMQQFLKFPSDSTLKMTKFFSKENTDGRNGQSWFNLIQHTYQNPEIDLFFFDNFETMQIKNRDSAMYLSLVQQKNQFKNRKIITLSGNLHNSMIAVGEMKTMGSYCKNDSLNFNSNRICSINHYYSEGEMYNNTGEGIKLREIEFKASTFSISTALQNYLVFYQSAVPSPNNCAFYSRKVSASLELK